MNDNGVWGEPTLEEIMQVQHRAKAIAKEWDENVNLNVLHVAVQQLFPGRDTKQFIAFRRIDPE